jgi:hypothetical protein
MLSPPVARHLLEPLRKTRNSLLHYLLGTAAYFRLRFPRRVLPIGRTNYRHREVGGIEHGKAGESMTAVSADENFI